VKQPSNSYYYPGATFSGPIIIPGTRFNKNHDKLFFFNGFEFYKQTLDTGLLRATVPTPGELTGNFSPEEIAKEGNITASGKAPGQLTSAAITKFGGTQLSPCTGPSNGTCIDPNMLALAKQYPAANADPNSTGGYNYTQSEIFAQNNRQWTIRGDYSIVTLPRSLCATTTSAKRSFSRLASGGAMVTRFRIRPPSKARTSRMPIQARSPTCSARP